MSDSTAPPILTDRIRRVGQAYINPIAVYLHRLGIHPDAITVLGTGLVALAALAITQERLGLGGLIVLIGLPLDSLDGSVARLRDRPRPFGAFLDSTLDRYADGMLFGALVIYGERTDSSQIMILSLVALVGAYLVSYTRARAEGLGLDCRVGLLTRMERTIILLILLITGWVVPGIWILAIGTHFTALQRIWYVRRLTLVTDRSPKGVING